MAVFFWYLVTCPVYGTVHMYTGQVTFSKILEKTRPCLTGHPVQILAQVFEKNPILNSGTDNGDGDTASGDQGAEQFNDPWIFIEEEPRLSPRNEIIELKLKPESFCNILFALLIFNKPSLVLFCPLAT